MESDLEGIFLKSTDLVHISRDCRDRLNLLKKRGQEQANLKETIS